MSTDTTTRHEAVVTSLSWIPTEAIEGAQRLAFDSGVTHYDAPPPAEGMDVETLSRARIVSASPTSSGPSSRSTGRGGSGTAATPGGA